MKNCGHDSPTRLSRVVAVSLLLTAMVVGTAAVSSPAGAFPTGLDAAIGGDLQPAERLAVQSPGDQPDGDQPGGVVSDGFAGTGPLLGYTTTKPDVLPKVGRIDGRYHAEVTDNAGNKTLHFNAAQGRLDAKLVSFPFDYVVRNIGIGSLSNAQVAPNPAGSTYMFSGVQVHSTDLGAADSAHVVVGHRGNTTFTVEGKNTVDGRSSVNDVGANTVPDGRADIRIVGNSDRSLTVYWQRPNVGSGTNDNWQLYRGTGRLPGTTAAFGASVYIGLITYAYGTGSVPFVGTADSIELVGE